MSRPFKRDDIDDKAKRFKDNRHDRDTKLSISFNRQTFQKNFPSFSKPKILGNFSVDGNRRYCGDRSQLKFFNENRFKKPGTDEYGKVEWDLNSGMDKVSRKLPACKDEKIDHMLR